MREIVAADQPFVREELDRDDGLRGVRRPALQARDHREGRRVGGRRGHRSISLYRNPRPDGDRVRRPVPRPARAVHQAARRVQAHARSPARTGAATRTARCSSASTAPRGSRRPRSRSTCTGSRRPSGATTASSVPSSTSSRSPRRSARGSRSSTRRAARPQAHGGLLARAPRGGGLRVRELAAHHEGAPVRDVGPPRLVRRRACSRRWTSTRRGTDRTTSSR